MCLLQHWPESTAHDFEVQADAKTSSDEPVGRGGTGEWETVCTVNLAMLSSKVSGGEGKKGHQAWLLC